MTEECCLIYPCLEPGEPDNTQFIVGSSDTQGSSIGFDPGPQENRELFLEMVVVCIRRHSFPHKPSGSALEVPTGACQNLHRASQSVIDIWTAIESSVIKPKCKSLERHYFGSLANFSVNTQNSTLQCGIIYLNNAKMNTKHCTSFIVVNSARCSNLSFLLCKRCPRRLVSSTPPRCQTLEFLCGLSPTFSHTCDFQRLGFSNFSTHQNYP